MFPLLDKENGNPLELFQIWLNLPAADKMVDPYFTMLWSDALPVVHADGATITVIAGALGDAAALAPPPESYAAHAEADVAIWHIAHESGASWELPSAARAETVRVLYVFEGNTVTIADTEVANDTAVVVDSNVALRLTAGDAPVEILLLQGVPLNEPVAQYGPFVMNTQDEIEQAFLDYRETQFGGWPGSTEAPDHGTQERFARHPDGRVEHPV
jgi:redox-sensitive bicupin YhaK (pirin superfamily)